MQELNLFYGTLTRYEYLNRSAFQAHRMAELVPEPELAQLPSTPTQARLKPLEPVTELALGNKCTHGLEMCMLLITQNVVSLIKSFLKLKKTKIYIFAQKQNFIFDIFYKSSCLICLPDYNG